MVQDGLGENSDLSSLDSQLEREIEDALGGQSVEQLMDQHGSADSDSAQPEPSAAESDHSSKPATVKTPGGEPKEFHADMKRGRIAAIRGDDVFVDLTGHGPTGGKLQGLVPLRQFDRPPRVGSIMDFVVDHVDEAEGLVYLSREGAVSRATWEQLQRGAVTDARVVSVNKGGLELEMVGGIRAFMPASQVDLHHVNDLESFVGQKLEGIVQEIDRKSKKVVLSRRQWIEQRRQQEQAKLLGELEVGQIREGVVTSVVDFGAFVDLGGIDGLIHVSDLSYTHVDNPADVLKPGQPVNVKVLKIDADKQRIGLGLKQIEPDPWDSVASKYHSGETVPARVLRTASFGAFVELEAGIEGLLPISEMSWKRIGKVEEVVSVGLVLHVGVLNVDVSKRRISVSLKQAQGDPWIGAERKYEKGSLVNGQTKSLTEFGAFVELETGVEGLVHISELADRRVGRVDEVLKVGDQEQFRVLEVSEDERKIKLSLRAVKEPAAPQPTRGEDSASARAEPARAQTRKQRKDLKSGLGNVEGKGLGQLNLDDFK